jgi:hypothetical protein
MFNFTKTCGQVNGVGSYSGIMKKCRCLKKNQQLAGRSRSAGVCTIKHYVLVMCEKWSYFVESWSRSAIISLLICFLHRLAALKISK